MLEPLQNGQVKVHRQGYAYCYPAHCLVLATQNNCACGKLGLDEGTCTCSINQLVAYRRLIFEPLLDRFDLFCELGEVKYVVDQPVVLEGNQIRISIDKARRRQLDRVGCLNARLSNEE